MSDKLGQAIAAIRAGDRPTGRRLLIEVIQSEPRNETAWLWMAGLVENEASYARCLENVLKINPNNRMARQSLATLLANSPQIGNDSSFATVLKLQPISQSNFESLSPASSSGSRIVGTIAGGIAGLILGSLILRWLVLPTTTAVLVSIILGSVGMFVGWMVGAGGPAKSLLVTTQSAGCLPATISGGAAGLVLSLLIGLIIVQSIGGWAALFIAPIVAGVGIGYLIGHDATEKIVIGFAGIVLGGVASFVFGDIGRIAFAVTMATIWLIGGIIGGARVGVKLVVGLAEIIEVISGSEARG